MDFNYTTLKSIQNTLPENKQQAKRYYGKHPYFTTRAWNVVHDYIQNFSQPGDTVLDPFGGSGVTAVEALILRRKGLHVDLSPLSVFLAEQTAISPINLGEAGEAFSRVKSVCEHTINDWFSMKDEEVRKLTIQYWYPKDIALPSNADVQYVHELFTSKQLISLAYLHDVIMQEKQEILRNLLLLTFSATLGKTNRTFLSASGRKESRGGSAIFSHYRYYVPDSPVELNVWEQFNMRWDGILKAKKETNEKIGDFYNAEDFRAINGSATELTDFIPEESVDYVFTDPPYGAHIAYLDLATMWHAWMRSEISNNNKSKEAIEGVK